MLWFKRNLFFVIGLAAGVILLGVAAFQLWDQMNRDREVRQQLEQRFEDLRFEYAKPIFPSRKNIGLIQADVDKINKFIVAGLGVFAPVPPIRFRNEQEFKLELEKILDYLNKEAHTKNVLVPTNYAYSFQKQKTLIRFEYSSLSILARQLAEIKALCQVLFDAKINRLEAIQRARASKDDEATDSLASDYVLQPIQNNPVAMVMPYRLTFRCFSSELTDVVNGLMQSPHGFLVKYVDVEPVALDFSPSGGLAPGGPGPGSDPGGMPPPPPFMSRGGRRFPIPGVPPAIGRGLGGVNTNRLVTLVSERPFRVVMQVETVARGGGRVN